MRGKFGFETSSRHTFLGATLFYYYLHSQHNTSSGCVIMDETAQVFYPARGKADLARGLPSLSRSQWWKKRLLARAISQPLDRVQVLGNDVDYGHTGLAFYCSSTRAHGS